jgi:DNA primase catalytic subunit
MTTMEQFAIQSRGRYYKSKYPAKALFELMSRHCCATQREIAIETEKYFKRYVSVSSVKELQTLLETPNLKALHLGACYAPSVCENGDGDGNAKSSTNTNNTNTSTNTNGGAAVAVKRGATAIGRELVFEIDLTDYEFLKLEKTEQARIDAQFAFCSVGITLLELCLRKCFGFETFLVVYSGRRGMHLYVLDEAAFWLSNEQRSAITDFFVCGCNNNKLRSLKSILGSIVTPQRMWNSIKKLFYDVVLPKTTYFENSDALYAFAMLVGLDTEAATRVSKFLNSSQAIREVERMCMRAARKNRPWKSDDFKTAVLTYVWPRVDAQVSRQTNHLLKVPMSLHASTLRVATPVSQDLLVHFDPSTDSITTCMLFWSSSSSSSSSPSSSSPSSSSQSPPSSSSSLSTVKAHPTAAIFFTNGNGNDDDNNKFTLHAFVHTIKLPSLPTFDQCDRHHRSPPPQPQPPPQPPAPPLPHSSSSGCWSWRCGDAIVLTLLRTVFCHVCPVTLSVRVFYKYKYVQCEHHHHHNREHVDESKSSTTKKADGGNDDDRDDDASTTTNAMLRTLVPRQRADAAVACQQLQRCLDRALPFGGRNKNKSSYQVQKVVAQRVHFVKRITKHRPVEAVDRKSRAFGVGRRRIIVFIAIVDGDDALERASRKFKSPASGPVADRRALF